jgi:hypothetical protein
MNGPGNMSRLKPDQLERGLNTSRELYRPVSKTVEPVKHRVETHPRELESHDLDQLFFQKAGPTFAIRDQETEVIPVNMMALTKTCQKVESRDRTENGSTVLRKGNLVNPLAILQVLRQNVSRHDAAIVFT